MIGTDEPGRNSSQRRPARPADPRPARHVASRSSSVDALLAHVRPALEDAREQVVVGELRAQLVRRGNGSLVQRAAYARTGRFEDVVADAVRRTVA